MTIEYDAQTGRWQLKQDGQLVASSRSLESLTRRWTEARVVR